VNGDICGQLIGREAGMAQHGVVHTNVNVLRPPLSDLRIPPPSLNILPGSTPNVRQPHTASANAITQSS